MNWDNVFRIFSLITLAYVIRTYWFQRAGKNQPRLVIKKETLIDNWAVGGDIDLLIKLENTGDAAVFKVECRNFDVQITRLPTVPGDDVELSISKDKFDKLATIDSLHLRYKGDIGIAWWHVKIPIRLSEKNYLGVRAIVKYRMCLLGYISMPT